MSSFQPPPTWALPVIESEVTKESVFNPIWLKWFIDLAKNLGVSGAGSGDALTTDPLSQFAATTSAQLAGVISDETGSAKLVFSTSPALTTPTVAGYMTLDKVPTGGIKIDVATPTFGWHDILGQITIRSIGAADPTFSVFQGGIRAFEFSATVLKEVYLIYHVPHDYVLGTDVYFHVHWANAAAVPNTGDVIWGFEYSYAKGYDQEAFPASTTVTVTQACPATQYQHNIAETTAVTIAGMEPDGVIMCRVYRDAAAAGDTCTDSAFLLMADVHYQSTNIATKGRNATGSGFYV